LDSRIDTKELETLYRTAKGQFLALHRIMIRLGLVNTKERIDIYDLTKTSN